MDVRVWERSFYFFNRTDDNDEERVGHGEQHPDIEHLDVSGARQISGYPDEAENINCHIHIYIINGDIGRCLLSGEDQEEGGVDLDENIEI